MLWPKRAEREKAHIPATASDLDPPQAIPVGSTSKKTFQPSALSKLPIATAWYELRFLQSLEGSRSLQACLVSLTPRISVTRKWSFTAPYLTLMQESVLQREHSLREALRRCAGSFAQTGRGTRCTKTFRRVTRSLLFT